MGYLGRRIGKSQTTGNPAADGNGAGLLDLFANGYFQRTGNVYNAPGSVTLTGLTATGGVISDYSDPGPGAIYRAHIFTSSGTFNVSAIGNYPATVDILNVAGGGGGSGSLPNYWAGSGGGAGGMIEVSGYPISTITYPVVVGSGGVGSQLSAPNTSRGFTGVDSEFNNPGNTGISVISKGGGGGGGSGPTVPGDAVRDQTGGGSGGGVGSAPGLSPINGPAIVTHPNNPTIAALSGVTFNHYGNVGGSGESGTTGESSGGGGAGGAGTSSSPPFSVTADNPGGAGRGSVYAEGPGNPITYAAGGGGGPAFSKGGGAGGLDGTYSRGNGGSGGSNPPSAERGGSGGSGIVVVRYQIGQLTAQQKATGGAISYDGTYTYHVFTSTGSFNVTNGPISAQTLIVAGGGGGGSYGGGGGAGGLVLYGSPMPTKTANGSAITYNNSTNYTINIGGGGTGNNYPSPETGGTNGTASSVTHPSGPYSATAGGGGGGNVGRHDGNPGGSGGGASNQNASGSPGPGTSGQGNGGGAATGSGAPNIGGGGGGAGGGGVPGATGGHGGLGLQLPGLNGIAGVPGPGGGTNWFAGGGGGSGQGSSSIRYGGAGPAGGARYSGGGTGGGPEPDAGIPYNDRNGTANSGGGGGGVMASPTTPGNGFGGSGVVVIWYPS